MSEVVEPGPPGSHQKDSVASSILSLAASLASEQQNIKHLQKFESQETRHQCNYSNTQSPIYIYENLM